MRSLHSEAPRGTSVERASKALHLGKGVYPLRVEIHKANEQHLLIWHQRLEITLKLEYCLFWIETE